MNRSDTDRIHKEITLAASRSRVWRALTDHQEFGAWFLVDLEGPFRVGEKFQGRTTHPECRGVLLQAWVEQMEPETLFSFRWHPHAIDPDFDYSKEPTTLVEFRLEDAGSGTRLTVTESGFEAIPEGRRAEAFLRNDGGWTAQIENIRAHVDG